MARRAEQALASEALECSPGCDLPQELAKLPKHMQPVDMNKQVPECLVLDSHILCLKNC